MKPVVQPVTDGLKVRPGFDLAALTAQFNEERRSEEQAKRTCAAAARTSIVHAIKEGNILARIKDGLPRGEWTPWLKANQVSERTAQRYIRLWREYGAKPDTVSGLTQREAIRLASETIGADEGASETRVGLTDEDAVPVLPEEPACRIADLWILGDHKLLVGDCTNQAEVARLMAGDSADLVFTDPPYNVDYEGYTEDRLTIKGDRMSDADFKQFLEAAFRSFRAVVKSSASIYVCHASSWQREFQNTLEAVGFKIRSQIIWAKNTFGWGFARYKFQHGPIFYCHVAGKVDAWYGDKSQSTVWQEKKPRANRSHPTMKPVELIERALHNSSKESDIVADLFAGSGSTLIACEHLGRKARLMEIDPVYAQVIIQRWQDYCGKSAVLDGDGRTFEEIAQAPRRAA